MNKFEQVSNLAHQMSLACGRGSLYSEVPCSGVGGRAMATGGREGSVQCDTMDHG